MIVARSSKATSVFEVDKFVSPMLKATTIWVDQGSKSDFGGIA
jgi:hypothetical protein